MNMTRSIGAGPALMTLRSHAPGDQETGSNSRGRGKLGSKRHIVRDLVSGTNRHDSKMFESCVEAIPAIAGLEGRLHKRPSKLHATRAITTSVAVRP